MEDDLQWKYDVMKYWTNIESPNGPNIEHNIELIIGPIIGHNIGPIIGHNIGPIIGHNIGPII